MDTRLKKALKDFLSSYVKVHNKNLTMDDIEVTFVKGFNAGQISMKKDTLTAKVKRYETALDIAVKALTRTLRMFSVSDKRAVIVFDAIQKIREIG